MLCKLWTVLWILILKLNLATHTHFHNSTNFTITLANFQIYFHLLNWSKIQTGPLALLIDIDESARGYGDPIYALPTLERCNRALSATFNFDFSQNNWHLWLQFEVAMWLSENDVS